MMSNLITVDYFKEVNPLLDTSAFSDTTISGLISVASRRVRSFLEYDPIISETTEKVKGIVNSSFDLEIYPTRMPIQSVSSIKLVKGNDDITLTLTEGGENKYNIPFGHYRIVYPYKEISIESQTIIGGFQYLQNDLFFAEITYTAGYETIPDDIQYATSLLALDQLARTSNPTGAESIRQGDITVKYSGGGSSSKANMSDNVSDAFEILNTYKRVIPV